MVEGERAIQQILNSRPEAIVEIITVEGLPHTYHGYSLRLVTEKQFRTIANTKTPQGVMAVVQPPIETSGISEGRTVRLCFSMSHRTARESYLLVTSPNKAKTVDTMEMKDR